MSETEWTDTPEKAMWRALIPEAAAEIGGIHTPGGMVGDGSLAYLLAARVLAIAFKERETLMADALANAWDDGYEAALETNPHVDRAENPYRVGPARTAETRESAGSETDHG